MKILAPNEMDAASLRTNLSIGSQIHQIKIHNPLLLDPLKNPGVIYNSTPSVLQEASTFLCFLLSSLGRYKTWQPTQHGDCKQDQMGTRETYPAQRQQIKMHSTRFVACGILCKCFCVIARSFFQINRGVIHLILCGNRLWFLTIIGCVRGIGSHFMVLTRGTFFSRWVLHPKTSQNLKLLQI